MASAAVLPRAVFGVPVNNVPAPEDDVADVAVSRAMRSRLYKAVLQLELDERHVIVFHYGLAGAEVRTLRRLGDDLGISAAGVLRLERRALDRLRAWL